MKSDVEEHGDAALATTPTAPQVHLARIEEIRTVEVMEHEIDTLGNALAAEQQALAFAMFAGGVCLSTALGWLGAGHLTIAALVIYAVVTAVSGVATLWCSVTWWRERVSRHRIQQHLRTRVRSTAQRALNAN